MVRKQKLVAYLIGPMDYASDNGLMWRRHYAKVLKEKFNVECIIPNDEEKGLLAGIDIWELKEKKYDDFIKVMKKIIKMDLEFVKKADLIIGRWNGEPIAGTIGEATLAFDLNKKCYLVSNRPTKEFPNWFAGCFTQQFKTLKDLIEYLEEEL